MAAYDISASNSTAASTGPVRFGDLNNGTNYGVPSWMIAAAVGVALLIFLYLKKK